VGQRREVASQAAGSWGRDTLGSLSVELLAQTTAVIAAAGPCGRSRRAAETPGKKHTPLVKHSYYHYRACYQSRHCLSIL
jgi:hypothetical protein